jgi:probable acetyl xylan esterase
MKKIPAYLLPLFAAATMFGGELYVAQPKELSRTVMGTTMNYDESKADIYKKLDILDKIGEKGRVESARQWLEDERPKVIKFLEDECFGKMPPRPAKLEFKLAESSDNALDGTAMRRQYKIISTDANGTHTFNVLLYYPKNASKENPVPAFVYPNYGGNHTTTLEKKVLLPEADAWLRNNPACKISDNKAHDYQRGTHLHRHPAKEIVARGYAVATFNYNELYPDTECKFMPEKSVYKIFDTKKLGKYSLSIPAWAWGDCRVLDLLETLPFIDRHHIGVVGHSRLGKTALLAGALDKRFALTVSNSSGNGGAAMARRNYGENFEYAAFYTICWYLPKMKEYAADIESMPVDAPHRLAAIAPRLLYVLAGTKDFWADPKGECLSIIESAKIYALFGSKKIPTADDIRINTPFIGDGFGFVLYDGKHDITLYNWNRIMDFADAHGWTKK